MKILTGKIVIEMECLICHECLVHDPNPQKDDGHQGIDLTFERSEACSSCKNLTHTYCLSLWFDKGYVAERCPHCKVQVTPYFVLEVIRFGKGDAAAQEWKEYKELEADLERYHRQISQYYQSAYDYDSPLDSESGHEMDVESNDEGEPNDEDECKAEDESDGEVGARVRKTVRTVGESQAQPAYDSDQDID